MPITTKNGIIKINELGSPPGRLEYVCNPLAFMIVRLILEAEEEPVQVEVAEQGVRGPIIVNRCGVEQKRLIRPTALATIEMGYARGVALIGSRPFAHDRPQGGRVLIVVGRTADQDILAFPAVTNV